MMVIKNLLQTTPSEIYGAFTLAFKNYVVPIEFQEASTYRRWEEAGVDFAFSYGAFDGDQLVAFILQVPNGRILHNFGTGVIPSHRGRHLIEKIYERIIRESSDSFNSFTLEVIKENTKALNLYLKLGFKIKRELVCFKGNLFLEEEIDPDVAYEIHPLSEVDSLPGFNTYPPATENSLTILKKNPQLHELHLLKRKDDILAWAYYSPSSLTLRDMGATEPSGKNLEQLLYLMKLQSEAMRVMNIESASPLIPFFEARGLVNFVTQYEMSRKI
ncbi:MAG: GNAT family N-acetyltransferase [Bacteriovoracia bacterium]